MNTFPGASSPPNPYVGPRAFTLSEADRFYGRERETLELLDLLIAERIVLFYSPSGAGKSSLIQAALLPALEQESFQILPIIRVSLEPPVESRPVSGGTNRYLLSTIQSLDDGLPPEQRPSAPTLANLSLNEYLERWVTSDLLDNQVLIFDQFEEILTTDPTNRLAKQQFFGQLGEALRNHSRWALFSMREDFIAGLDPYLRLLPTRLSTTYRLDLLELEAARQAIQRPARSAGIDFTDEAGQKLLDDLCRVRVQRSDGTTEEQPGPYVEPVQLQVVCWRLWETLLPNATAIVMDDIETVGDVDSALASYYAEVVADVTTRSGVPERAIREWFEQHLITPQGLRNQVLQEPSRSADLDNGAIRLLVNAHLVRSEMRRGAIWFELAHDRLIVPIQKNNAVWFESKLNLLQRQAMLWDNQDRPGDLLLRDKRLAEATVWAQTHGAEMTPLEQDFLAASHEAQAVIRRDRRNNRLIRGLALLAIMVMIVAIYFAFRASTERDRADGEAQVAKSRQLAAQAITLLGSQPDLALLLSIEARRTADTVEARSSLLTLLQHSARLTTFLRQHPNEVLAVAFSPDGRTLASAGCGHKTAGSCDQGILLLWNTGDVRPREPPILVGHEAIASLAFTADGRRVVFADHTRTVRIWDIEKHSLDRELDAGDQVWSLATSTGSSNLAVGTAAGSVLLWDLTASTPMQRALIGHRDRVISLAFSPDDTLLASGSGDQTVIIWDVAQGVKRYPPFSGHTAPVSALAFASNGTVLASGGQDKKILLWNLAANPPENRSLSGHTGALTSLVFGSEGRILASAALDKTIILWDPVTGQPIATLFGHRDPVSDLAFNSDGRTLVAGSWDSTLSIWDVTRVQRLGTRLLAPAAQLVSLAFAPDGSTVAWSDKVHNVGFADITTDVPVTRTVPLPAAPVSKVALSGAGRTVALGQEDGVLLLWERFTQPAPVRIGPRLNSSTAALTFSVDGKMLAAGGCAKFTNEGICNQGRILVIALPSGQLLHDWIGQNAEIATLAFSPNGHTLAAGARDNTTSLWDLRAAASAPRLLSGHADWVVSLAFNRTGNLLATGSRDQRILLWDVNQGRQLDQPPLIDNGAYASSLAFSPDDRVLATGDSTGQLILWDWASGQPIAEPLTYQPTRLLAVAYSSDGRRLVAGDATTGVILWDVAVESWEARACGIANRNLTKEEWVRYLGRDTAYRPTCQLLP